ncbi:hypothetical protein [Niabella beijingensis]|uniref:hypothetical protein n=1 Tax=Niabella beijingensis TaxID=2872700 RepID=UPI001CC0A049|nr:hypothetical protein [Niabella beijingensis]MBZ4188550.1 hypothetical protein [Niabella beijingensis]
MRSFWLTVFLLNVLYGSGQPTVNGYLDNSAISSTYADTALYHTGNIYSVRYYKMIGKNEVKSPLMRMKNGLSFLPESYTEYLPDGRRSYRETYGGNTTAMETYHYDRNSGMLLLLERTGQPESTYYWLFYDRHPFLKEAITVQTDKKKRFRFQSYEQYRVTATGADTLVRITGYGYDTIAGSEKSYRFAYPYLVKQLPEYQSKWQRFRLTGGSYRPVETKGYIFDDRSVNFTYDANGFITAEVWYKPEGRLENKTEYYYTDDYAERTEQRYHMLGTEKSLKTVRRYNKQGDILFEQSTEYTGNLQSINSYEYIYDSLGNWVERRAYYQPRENGVYGEKQLIRHELRDITYFSPGSKVRQTVLPEQQFESYLASIRNHIPARAAEKKQQADAFNRAVETGDYDTAITKTTAGTLTAFAPRYWTLRDSAFGDLDGIEGDEAVAVYKTPLPAEMGFASCLAVFKKEQGQWKLWHQTVMPLLGDQNGGMMGDPYDGVAIARRCIVISHFGGSRQKWNYTHRYRFQSNNWYLVGAAVHFGAPCDYMDQLDYNLSTGDVVIRHTTEDCEKETIKEGGWTERMNLKRKPPLMDDFIPGETELRLVKRKLTYYY